MRVREVVTGLVVTVVLAAYSVSATAGEPIAGVASVIDGDTLEIHGQRIRLFGIDAPESNQTCTRNGGEYRCGKDAAFALADKIGHQTVNCSPRDTDRYGRTVAVCSTGDLDLNGWMVREGFAFAYRKYAPDYLQQEAEAKTAQRGLWAGAFEWPWDYRHKGRHRGGL